MVSFYLETKQTNFLICIETEPKEGQKEGQKKCETWVRGNAQEICEISSKQPCLHQ
jgi:hypothetical protein